MDKNRVLCPDPVHTLLAAGVGLRLLLFWQPSLWIDEAKTVIILQAPVQDLFALIRGLEATPPLYFLIAHAWVSPFPNTLVGLRLLSVILGCLALWAFSLLSRRLLPTHGYWATALACLSPFWIHLSQDGRAYPLYLLAVVGLGLAWHLLDDHWSNRKVLVYAVVALAGLYTHICFGFALLAPFLLGLRSDEIGCRRWIWCAVHIALMLAFLLWLPSLRAQMSLPQNVLLTDSLDLKNLGLLFATHVIDLPFLNLAFARSLSIFGLGTIVAVFLTVAWAARHSDAKDRRILLVVAMNIVLPLLAAKFVEVALGRSLSQPRYLLVVSPYIYISLAWTLGRLPSRMIRIVAVAVFALSASAYFACRLMVDPRLDRLSEALRLLSPPTETVIHLDPYYYPALRYYYLPERRHLLLCADPKILPWDMLPGYPATVSSADLQNLGQVILVDPRHLVSNKVLSRSNGPMLSRYRCP